MARLSISHPPSLSAGRSSIRQEYEEKSMAMLCNHNATASIIEIGKATKPRPVDTLIKVAGLISNLPYLHMAVCISRLFPFFFFRAFRFSPFRHHSDIHRKVFFVFNSPRIRHFALGLDQRSAYSKRNCRCNEIRTRDARLWNFPFYPSYHFIK